MQEHDLYMQRCIQLALLGFGNVAPNPMVGCVIVYQNKILAEGYHQKFGGAHAEVNAINNVEDKSLLANSTVYVNLEPCAHHGKTPPCANLLVKHKIKKVVIGCIDNFAEVNGVGIKILRKAGIEVILGVLEQKCLELNKRFFSFYNHITPYIILKWAQSSNGIIGNSTLGNIAVSNASSKVLNHKWRSEEQAILIGKNTANIDNPSLTTRLVNGNNPIRFVVDLNNKLRNDLRLLNDDFITYIFTKIELKDSNYVKYLIIKNTENCLPEILNHLHQLNIQSVIIEGGTSTIQKFIDNNLWDEARILESTKNISGNVLAPVMKQHLLIYEQNIVSNNSEIDTLKIYNRNKN
jgi:diaminohydroxyphosphoribosylaminopyrimidine deaminase/5-amino-6-(5-phosphoribosylamino)uracil reductase